MLIQVRTRDDLSGLLQSGETGCWIIDKNKLGELSRVRVASLNGQGCFDAAITSVRVAILEDSEDMKKKKRERYIIVFTNPTLIQKPCMENVGTARSSVTYPPT